MQKASKLMERTNVISLLLAMIFALFTQIGRSYIQEDNWSLLIGKRELLNLMLIIVGYFFIIRILYGFLDDKKNIISGKELKTDKLEIKKILWISIFFFVAWSPYLIIFYPGSIPPDTSVQLSQFFGKMQWTDHHPVFSSLLMGLSVQIGMIIKDANLGVFLYTVLQSMATAFACGYMIAIMKKYAAPLWLLIGTAAYFSIFPLWGLTVQTVVKDTLFNAIVMIFVIFLFDDIYGGRVFIENRKRTLMFIFLMILMTLLRKNGIYVAYTTLFFMLLLYGKFYKRILIVLTVMIIFYTTYSNLLLPSLGVMPGSVKEALSIPFQQTARYLREYPEDISLQEKEMIDQVLEVDVIAEKYISWLSDPVKNTFRENAGKEELKGYFKAWWNMFLRHPDVYIQATLHNSYGYYYPVAPVQGGYGSVMIQVGDSMSDLGIGYPDNGLEKYREHLYHFTYHILDSTWLHWLACPGFYTWILLFTTGFTIIKRNYQKLIIMIPSYTILMTCIASPVNAYVRYALPMIAVTPIIFLLLLENRKREVM